MPLYDFRCSAHGVFDGYAPMSRCSEPQACPVCGEMSEKVIVRAPRVFGDYEGYVSPASGKWIEGRKARERDFEETGTRPYEVGEWRTNVLRRAQAEQELDAEIDETVERTIGELRAN